MERLGMRKHRVLHRLEMHPSRCGPPMPEAAPDPTLRIATRCRPGDQYSAIINSLVALW